MADAQLALARMNSYYGAYDESGSPIGLFRLVIDDDAHTLDFERLGENGEWIPDPDAITELREPTTREVSADEAQGVMQEIATRRQAEMEADQPVAPADEMTFPER